jgi:CheY-like chemotaxis protein
MNLLFSIKDFNLGINNSTFFEIAKLSPGNYDDDIDQIIHSFLLEKKSNEIRSFTIPINLSNNFMEFSGLLLAHHIRLSREFKFCDVPIVFYGSLKLEQLLRITPLARILLTSNVFYVDISKFSFHDIEKSLDGYKIKLFDINTFLDQIQIKQPVNYDSHHSVDNEFALIQWSKFINCYDELPPSIKKEYESKLYFKYLKLKQTFAKVEKPIEKPIIEITENIRILLIDDEASKGWEGYYSSLFSNSSKKIKFEDSGIDFKNIYTTEDIVTKVELKVSDFKPDVVLLDLRLLDSDFLKETLPNELTGLKVLKKIKEINKGIQVIITTASNKAWNFNLAKQKGAYDFIIKDGFEDPKKAISKFITTIEISSKRAGFLKVIDQKLSDIKSLIISNYHFKDKDNDEQKSEEIKEDKIRMRMFSNLEIAFELMDLSYKIPDKDKYLAYSYLQLFLLIEDFVNPDYSEKLNPVLFKESEEVFVSHSLKQICIIQNKNGKKYTRLKFEKKYKIDGNLLEFERRIDTNFFVSSILIYKYGNPNSSVRGWTSVNNVRNDVAHKGYTPNESEIKDLLDFIIYFLDNSNESNTNLEKGLVPLTYEDRIQAFIEKYNRK